MAQAARFVIDEEAGTSPPGRSLLASVVRRTPGVLSWIELAVLLPSKLLAAVGWLAIPLVVFTVVPVVLLGTLLLAQAPVFFLLWKLFGAKRSANDGSAERDFLGGTGSASAGDA